MSLTESRYAIVESVSAMDQVQARKVLDYINDLLEKKAEKEAYLQAKEEALREISKALQEA